MRDILSLSGGKDSAALAIYMRDRVPGMEYVFSDTRKELPETYEYLERVEDYLGKRVNRLNAELGFDHWYDVYGGMIPSNHRRWCTKMLKLKPFEDFVGDDPVLNYVGLRADEDRTGYISHKPNITPVYPFQDDGLKLPDIEEILRSSGVGMPPYTEWGTIPLRLLLLLLPAENRVGTPEGTLPRPLRSGQGLRAPVRGQRQYFYVERKGVTRGTRETGANKSHQGRKRAAQSVEGRDCFGSDARRSLPSS